MKLSHLKSTRTLAQAKKLASEYLKNLDIEEVRKENQGCYEHKKTNRFLIQVSFKDDKDGWQIENTWVLVRADGKSISTNSAIEFIEKEESRIASLHSDPKVREKLIDHQGRWEKI